jgi:prepilin-type N-terminal cleavage/methylation domain-containing protein
VMGGRAIMKVLMLKWDEMMTRLDARGDTLIEVTIALAILGFVLLGSTAIGAAAFRTGQTARERTQVAEVAQEQMEALRSFRDNHTWNEFRHGNGGSYQGIDNVLGTACQWDGSRRCFHMELKSTGANTEWVPVTGPLTQATPGNNLTVPGSVVEIATTTTAASECGYDFLLHYQFLPLGGGANATNQITTRLVNLKYDPSGGSPCL